MNDAILIAIAFDVGERIELRGTFSELFRRVVGAFNISRNSSSVG
jgi:hypothetical protein